MPCAVQIPGFPDEGIHLVWKRSECSLEAQLNHSASYSFRDDAAERYRTPLSSGARSSGLHQSSAIMVSAELTSTPGPSSIFRWVTLPSSTIIAKR